MAASRACKAKHHMVWQGREPMGGAVDAPQLSVLRPGHLGQTPGTCWLVRTQRSQFPCEFNSSSCAKAPLCIYAWVRVSKLRDSRSSEGTKKSLWVGNMARGARSLENAVHEPPINMLCVAFTSCPPRTCTQLLPCHAISSPTQPSSKPHPHPCLEHGQSLQQHSRMTCAPPSLTILWAA